MGHGWADNGNHVGVGKGPETTKMFHLHALFSCFCEKTPKTLGRVFPLFGRVFPLLGRVYPNLKIWNILEWEIVRKTSEFFVKNLQHLQLQHIFNMSFVSNQHSAETLARGLEIARSDSMSFGKDPNPEDLMQELERLQEPFKNCIL